MEQQRYKRSVLFLATQLGSVSGVQLEGAPFFNYPTFLKNGYYILDSIGFGDGIRILFKKIFDPRLSQIRQGVALFGLNIPIVVEDCNFIFCWLLFMLYYELFNVLAPTKQLLSILHLENGACPFVPCLSFDLV